MISTCSQSAPCSMVFLHSAPSWAKSAERIEGAMIALGAMVGSCWAVGDGECVVAVVLKCQSVACSCGVCEVEEFVVRGMESAPGASWPDTDLIVEIDGGP